MSNPFDAELRATLHEVADQVEIPELEVRRLAANAERARRTRFRRNVLAAVGIAAGIGVALSITVVRVRRFDYPAPAANQRPAARHQENQQPQSLPHGAAPRLPYWRHGLLRWDGRQRPLPYPSLTVANGQTLVTWRHLRGYAVAVVEGRRFVRLPVRSAEVAVIGATGHSVAWQVPAGSGKTRVVVWNLVTSTVVGRLVLPVQAGCCSGLYPNVVGIGRDGRVYIQDERGSRLWNPASGAVQQITGLRRDDHLAAVTAAGPMFANNAGSNYGYVDRHGAFHPLGHLPSQSAAWSPHGGLAAYQRSHGAYIRDLHTGQTHRIRLPTAWAVNLLVWESPSKLLVAAADPLGRLWWLRCPVTGAGCQLAAAIGSLPGIGLSLPG